MPIQRVFIDWETPILKDVAERMVRLSAADGFCDLSNRIAVFPGTQAGRRFLELLTIAAQGALSPPKIITVGQLPEQLYRPQKPFASPLTQRLAWAKALQNYPAEQLSAIIPHPPAPDDLRGWIHLGELLRTQHAELAGDLLDFGDVAELGASLPEFQERDRWQILTEIQQNYLDILDSLNVWDRQTARLVAIERQECATGSFIDLIGAVDLNRTMRGMLSQVADRVTAYVHASSDWKTHFDDFGCLIPDTWSDVPIDLANEQIRVVDSPADQIESVIRELAEWGSDYSISDVVIGVPDDSLVLPLRRRLDDFRIPTQWPLEQGLASTRPFRLLAAVADYLASRSTADFSAMIRHPDLTAWLDRRLPGLDWLNCWQCSFREHLHQRTDRLIVRKPVDELAARLVETVDHLLKPLRSKPRTLAEWRGAVEDLLQAIYGRELATEEDSASMTLFNACRCIVAALAEHAEVPEALNPRCLANEAIRLMLSEIRQQSLAGKMTPDGLRLSGWLDLPLDDAPALILTSLNEGVIPSSVNHDLFLPNRLRGHLGIEDNCRRYARDLYALRCLLAGKQKLCLIVGRTTKTGDPLVPSRLLFATDPETVARRILEFYGNAEGNRPAPAVMCSVSPGSNSRFSVPRPPDRPVEKDSFRVTEFKDYLVSPYRYYLRHILNLGEDGDAADELDAAAFGELIHGVLKAFGESPAKELDSEDELARVLLTLLQAEFVHRYGETPLAGIQLQQKQAEMRLLAFAGWQATWRRQGWEIREVERSVADVPFPLSDGRTIRLRGRIDRIDYHPGREEWAIFDYKTGDKGKDPAKAHHSGEDWVDFQLPLYRHLAAACGVSGVVRLGYLSIPRDTSDISERFADWTDAELREADAAAADIAAQILDGRFWVEQEQDPNWLHEFDSICQTGVFNREAIV